MSKNEWEPSIAFLIDLLSIVNLKSIKLEHKDEYEQEAQEIMNSIHNKLKRTKINNYGKLVRSIQVNTLANEFIWSNETKARLGGESQNHLLPLTHSINGLRTRAGNLIIANTGGRKDLNLDRLNEELCKKFGFDFRRIP